MRIHLFVPCFVDTLFPEAGAATVRVLERLGHEVVFPAAQTCCGQIHYNTGYGDGAGPLLGRFLDIFDDATVVVAPSASCVAMVREGYPRLARAAGDATLADRVARIAPRVHELSTFLVEELGVEDVGARYPHRVTYHPTCHSLRHLRVGSAPLRLLRAVRDLDLVELPGAEECCGFGGTFAVKNADVSAAMLSDKVRAIQSTGAQVCTAVDSSCLMHLGGGLHRLGSPVRTAHLAEILAAQEQP